MAWCPFESSFLLAQVLVHAQRIEKRTTRLQASEVFEATGTFLI